jgi:hypothetical protein
MCAGTSARAYSGPLQDMAWSSERHCNRRHGQVFILELFETVSKMMFSKWHNWCVYFPLQGTLNILQEGHWTETSENNFLPVCVQNLKDNSSIILMPCESSFNYDDGYVRYQLQHPKKAAVKVFFYVPLYWGISYFQGWG